MSDAIREQPQLTISIGLLSRVSQDAKTIEVGES